MKIIAKLLIFFCLAHTTLFGYVTMFRLFDDPIIGKYDIVEQMGVGLIPVAGQIADARDIAANAVNFWNEPSWGAAAGVAGAAVGLIPGVGD